MASAVGHSLAPEEIIVAKLKTPTEYQKLKIYDNSWNVGESNPLSYTLYILSTVPNKILLSPKRRNFEPFHSSNTNPTILQVNLHIIFIKISLICFNA